MVEQDEFTFRFQVGIAFSLPDRDPKFYIALLSFILFKRTDEQMDKLLTRLSECHCQLDDQGGTIPWYHELGKEKEAFLLDRGFLDEDEAQVEAKSGDQPVARQSFSKAKKRVFFVHFLHVLDMRLAVSAINATDKDYPKCWPMASTNLIPFGERPFCPKHVPMVPIHSGPSRFRIVGTVLHFCQSLIITGLL